MYAIDNKENVDIQKLQEELEKQYGPAVAQDIRDRIRKNGPIANTPEYMDVKAMSELQERFRAQAMMAVWKLKEWRKSQNKAALHQNLVQLEGVFLQRQCVDAIALYRLANKSYFAMYREAMEAFTLPTFAHSYKAGAVA
jgi:Zn-finger domain-containing protein